MKKTVIFLAVILLIVLGLDLYELKKDTRKPQPQNIQPEIISAEPEIVPVISKPEVSPKEISSFTPYGKQVVFTFDGGSGTNSLGQILQALKERDLRGTFFVTGKWAEQNPEAVRKIFKDGHDIYNHTYSHPYLTKITDDEMFSELERTENIVKGITGKSTQPFFRPPYGDRNGRVLEAAAAKGYRSVYWTADALDWKTDSTNEFVKQRILSNLKPGSIFLMHIGDDITGQVLEEVFDEVKARGYEIIPLSKAVIEI